MHLQPSAYNPASPWICAPAGLVGGLHIDVFRQCCVSPPGPAWCCHHSIGIMQGSLRLPGASAGLSTPCSRSLRCCCSCSTPQSGFISSRPSQPSLPAAWSHPLAPTSCIWSHSSSRSAVIARAAASADDEWEAYAADNFYQILGVPENASRRDIKRAYKAMMKDFHPDLSGDEESTEFCCLLNEIYDVSEDT